jgi:hypothetical protein
MSGGGGSTKTTNEVAIPQQFNPLLFGNGGGAIGGSGFDFLSPEVQTAFGGATQGGFRGVFPELISLFDSGNISPLPIFGELSQQGEASQLGFAQALQNSFLPQISGIFDSFGEGSEGIADIATAGLERQLERDTLPTIGQGAINAGQFGSSRQGIAEGLATAEANRDIADVRAQILQQGRQTQLGFAPMLASLMGMPSGIISGVGSAQDAREMATQDNDFQSLLRLSQLIQGFIPGATQTQSTSGGGPSRLQGAAGGAATGASIGGPWGALAGAAIGGLTAG